MKKKVLFAILGAVIVLLSVFAVIIFTRDASRPEDPVQEAMKRIVIYTDEGFQLELSDDGSYYTLEIKTVLEETVKVYGGKEKELCVYPERSYYAMTRRGEMPNVTLDVRFDRLKAPISQGEKVGEVLIYRDGVECDRINLLAANTIEKANFLDRLREIAQEWNG